MPAYFSATLPVLVETSNSQIISDLIKEHAADRYNFLYTAAAEAWADEIPLLKDIARSLLGSCSDAAGWTLHIEFWIPRRRKRCDAVLFANGHLFVLEFKKTFASQDLAQTEDYAVELAQFHDTSRDLTIFPVLISDVKRAAKPVSKEQVQAVSCTTADSAADEICRLFHSIPKSVTTLTAAAWEAGEYHPIPSIVEAAQAMFAEMEVTEIANADVGTTNLMSTIATLRNIVLDASENGNKVVCFVTGVPGAGKTLAGLRLVHDPEITSASGSNLAFMTGNGPLVEILQSALTDERKQRKNMKRRAAAKDPATLIQSVYSFKNTHWIKDTPPAERVLVFDEAQRAWSQQRNIKKLKQVEKDFVKKCFFSEPELILHILGRHDGWAVLIALVGGGQEIHDGEAGLEEWGASLQRSGKWSVVASGQCLHGGTGTSGSKLFPAGIPSKVKVREEPTFHLDNPTRQFRGKTVNEWVNALLEGDPDKAQHALRNVENYPVVISRDLTQIKKWVQRHRKGLERAGLAASSGNGRLRAYGIDTDSNVLENKIHHWFLRHLPDHRSSSKLEVTATEFQMQGLELDWIGLCWGGDMLRTNNRWKMRYLYGVEWKAEESDIDIRYTRNKYRVLLTRARKGIAIFIPSGDPDDPTLNPSDFAETYEFLLSCGAKLLT